MNPPLKTIAVTLLSSAMTLWLAACSQDQPTEPRVGAPQADVSILQVPANDDFEDAQGMGPLPATAVLSTVEATSADDDPADCDIGGHTVWFTFTPTVNMRLNANTFDSDYDTGIAVYTGSRGNLSLVICQDDVILGEFTQTNVNFDAVAGTTYFFMVGSFGDSPGGNLVFRVNTALDLGLTVDPSGSVDAKAGVATIRGTVTCAEPAFVGLDGRVQQRSGRTLINGFFGTFLECDGVTPWEVQVVGENGLYAGGRVQVIANAFAFERDFTRAEVTVNLKGKGK